MPVLSDGEKRARLRAAPGRKPVDQITDTHFPQTREAIWAAVRLLRQFTLLDLQAVTRITEATLQTYVLGLTRAGYLQRTPPAPRTPKGQMQAATWTLVRDVGVEAPRVTREGKPVTQGSGRERLWQSMRILKEFTRAELVAAATGSGKAIARSEVTSYLAALTQAGYLKSLTVPTATGRLARYRLVPVFNTGPRAPMVQRVKSLFDPNLGRVVWPRTGAGQ